MGGALMLMVIYTLCVFPADRDVCRIFLLQKICYIIKYEVAEAKNTKFINNGVQRSLDVLWLHKNISKR
jgi:hypothetical protein